MLSLPKARVQSLVGELRSNKPRGVAKKIKIKEKWDFPGGTVVKNLPANAEKTGSIPGPGRSHVQRSN